jgi:transcriptional regulator with XRE-family HTH domain
MSCQIANDILNSISYVESQLGSRALISAQIRAARSLIRWTADELAAASALSVATIRRAELKQSETSLTAANDLAIRRALEAAGVEFIDENGGGPGVRLRERHQKKR